MSNYSYLVIVFAGYMYRYLVRGFSCAHELLFWRIQEYHYLISKGRWTLFVEAMQFIQHQTFPSSKAKSKKAFANIILGTQLTKFFNVPISIVNIISDMAMPRPDTQLMKQTIAQHQADKSYKYNLTIFKLAFDLIDENNKECQANGMHIYSCLRIILNIIIIQRTKISKHAYN